MNASGDIPLSPNQVGREIFLALSSTTSAIMFRIQKNQCKFLWH